MKFIFTSEAVTEGHPDKIADRIADAVLDAALKEDKYSRVACEVVTLTDLVFIFGEITTNATIDFESIARRVVKEVGYTEPNRGFDFKTMVVKSNIHPQSADIKALVDSNEEKDLGAGDQGIMFGYASDETDVYMPLGSYLSQKLAYKLTEVRKDGTLPYLLPDGKTQVSVAYDNDKALYIDTILISAQHKEEVSLDKLRSDIEKYVVKEIIPSELLTKDTKILINPAGQFVIGGPTGDTGLTGRKTIVDTYGGYARNGGGAFSGKDPTKVDRSASYALRYLAKNIVAAGIAKRVELQASYGIGMSKPISLYVNTYGTGKISDEAIIDMLNKEFDLSPSNIINKLNLRQPIYEKTSVYGHFGRSEFPWESLDLVDTFKKYL